MDNAAIAKVFEELGDLTEIQGGDPHRIRAFRRVARVLEGLREPVSTMIRFRTLERVPGIGEGTVHRIKEILRTGTCEDYAKLVAAMPPGLPEMVKIPGIGVKTVRWLYLHERIASVDELEWAARGGRLRRLPGFGEDSSERVLAAIARYRRKVERLLLVDALRIGEGMRDAMRADPAVEKAELTGSARRRKETVGDLDLLIGSHEGAACVARFVSLPEIDEVLVRGDSKCSALVRSGQQIDLRVVTPEEFGAGLHYFTGSQQHNIYLRARGNRRGLKISEHGVFRRADEKLVDACESEAALFTAVGLPWIPPELRENTGEIEAAAKGKLPTLVEASAVRGDLHVYSRASAGATATPAELAAAAAALGDEYLAVTDHARAIRGSLDDLVPRLRRAGDDAGLDVLAGIEVHVLPDGSLDAGAHELETVDFVVASVQSAFDMPRKEMTARIIAAMETGLVDLLGTPTGRILGESSASEPSPADGARRPIDVDMEKLLKAARRLDVAVEVNGDPRRLDLDASACRYAGELGVPVALCSGAISPAHLFPRRVQASFVARRGWLEAKNLLNARPMHDILARRRARLKTRGVVVPGALARESRHRIGPGPAAGTGGALVPAAGAPRLPLEDALRMQPLPDWLLARLESFLHGADAELERALERVDPSRNPAQKAFDLLHTHGRT